MPSSRNRILTVCFAMLFALNLVYLMLGFFSIPAYYERVTTLTIPSYPVELSSYPTNETVQQNAARRSMTLAQYAVEQIAFNSGVVLLFVAVAALIVVRVRWNWFAWYSAFFLLFIAEYAFYDQVFVAQLVPIWVYEIGALGWPFILLYLFLFPNGKAVPRVALWAILPFFFLHLLFQTGGLLLVVSPNAPLSTALQGVVGIFNTAVTVFFISILGCQIYRYLRVSTAEEKQQTKWFLTGFVLVIILSTITDLLGELNPYNAELGLVVFTFVPLGVGTAILRYRLWDIDFIIRRTLTYALVTALLVVIFFGSVIVLQQVFSGLTGSGQNEIVTVLSTLAIAALFVPVRGRIQREIDKRFNRNKYDAQLVLADFAGTLRDETDLEKLTARLVQVVDETMQPKSVSVWLKKETQSFAKRSNHE